MKKNTSWKFTDESSVTFQSSVSGAGEFGLKAKKSLKKALPSAAKKSLNKFVHRINSVENLVLTKKKHFSIHITEKIMIFDFAKLCSINLDFHFLSNNTITIKNL